MNGTALHKPTARRVVGMVAGIVIIALGIALFKQSHLGNDSISALNMRLAELLGLSLIHILLCTGPCTGSAPDGADGTGVGRFCKTGSK